MQDVRMYISKGGHLGGELRKSAKALPGEVNRKVRHYGQLLRTRIMANASGRPGPNAPTGTYRRSWTLEVTQVGPATFQAEVGTNQPQGRRLEFGFHGADSLGRVYNQPPYPHVQPALDWLEGQLDRGFDSVLSS